MRSIIQFEFKLMLRYYILTTQEYLRNLTINLGGRKCLTLHLESFYMANLNDFEKSFHASKDVDGPFCTSGFPVMTFLYIIHPKITNVSRNDCNDV